MPLFFEVSPRLFNMQELKRLLQVQLFNKSNGQHKIYWSRNSILNLNKLIKVIIWKLGYISLYTVSIRKLYR